MPRVLGVPDPAVSTIVRVRDDPNYGVLVFCNNLKMFLFVWYAIVFIILVSESSPIPLSGKGRYE